MACVCGKDYHRGSCSDPKYPYDITLDSIHNELQEIKELIKFYGFNPSCPHCQNK